MAIACSNFGASVRSRRSGPLKTRMRPLRSIESAGAAVCASAAEATCTVSNAIAKVERIIDCPPAAPYRSLASSEKYRSDDNGQAKRKPQNPEQLGAGTNLGLAHRWFPTPLVEPNLKLFTPGFCHL